MKPIGRAMDRALRALGIDHDVARADAMRAWHAVVSETLGPDAVATRAVRADGDTLVVVVPSAQWASEIRLRERDLIRLLDERAPGSGITRIRVAPEASPTH